MLFTPIFFIRKFKKNKKNSNIKIQNLIKLFFSIINTKIFSMFINQTYFYLKNLFLNYLF